MADFTLEIGAAVKGALDGVKQVSDRLADLNKLAKVDISVRATNTNQLDVVYTKLSAINTLLQSIKAFTFPEVKLPTRVPPIKLQVDIEGSGAEIARDLADIERQANRAGGVKLKATIATAGSRDLGDETVTLKPDTGLLDAAIDRIRSGEDLPISFKVANTDFFATSVSDYLDGLKGKYKIPVDLAIGQDLVSSAINEYKSEGAKKIDFIFDVRDDQVGRAIDRYVKADDLFIVKFGASFTADEVGSAIASYTAEELRPVGFQAWIDTSAVDDAINFYANNESNRVVDLLLGIADSAEEEFRSNVDRVVSRVQAGIDPLTLPVELRLPEDAGAEVQEISARYRSLNNEVIELSAGLRLPKDASAEIFRVAKSYRSFVKGVVIRLPAGLEQADNAQAQVQDVAGSYQQLASANPVSIPVTLDVFGGEDSQFRKQLTALTTKVKTAVNPDDEGVPVKINTKSAVASVSQITQAITGAKDSLASFQQAAQRLGELVRQLYEQIQSSEFPVEITANTDRVFDAVASLDLTAPVVLVPASDIGQGSINLLPGVETEIASAQERVEKLIATLDQIENRTRTIKIRYESNLKDLQAEFAKIRQEILKVKVVYEVANQLPTQAPVAASAVAPGVPGQVPSGELLGAIESLVTNQKTTVAELRGVAEKLGVQVPSKERKAGIIDIVRAGLREAVESGREEFARQSIRGLEAKAGVGNQSFLGLPLDAFERLLGSAKAAGEAIRGFARGVKEAAAAPSAIKKIQEDFVEKFFAAGGRTSAEVSSLSSSVSADAKIAANNDLIRLRAQEADILRREIVQRENINRSLGQGSDVQDSLLDALRQQERAIRNEIGELENRNRRIKTVEDLRQESIKKIQAVSNVDYPQDLLRQAVRRENTASGRKGFGGGGTGGAVSDVAGNVFGGFKKAADSAIQSAKNLGSSLRDTARGSLTGLRNAFTSSSNASNLTSEQLLDAAASASSAAQALDLLQDAARAEAREKLTPSSIIERNRQRESGDIPDVLAGTTTEGDIQAFQRTRARQRRREGRDRAGGILGETIIGGGFPLLFGQGGGSAIGGGIGGLAGALVGPGGGFAGSLIGTVAGTEVDKVVNGLKAIADAADTASGILTQLEAAGKDVSDQAKFQVSQLEALGRAEEARAVAVRALKDAYGEDVIQEINALETAQNRLGESLKNFSKTIDFDLEKAIIGAIDIFADFVSKIDSAVSSINNVVNSVNEFFEGISSAISGAIDFLNGAFDSLLDRLGPFGDFIAFIADKLQGFGGGAKEKIDQIPGAGFALENPFVRFIKDSQKRGAERVAQASDQLKPVSPLQALEDQRKAVDEQRRAADEIRGFEEQRTALIREQKDLEFSKKDLAQSIVDLERKWKEEELGLQREIDETKIKTARAAAQIEIERLDLQFSRIAQGEQGIGVTIVNAAAEYIKTIAEGEADIEQQRKELELRIQDIRKDAADFEYEVTLDIERIKRQQLAYERSVEDYKLKVAQYQLQVARAIQDSMMRSAGTGSGGNMGGLQGLIGETESYGGDYTAFNRGGSAGGRVAHGSGRDSNLVTMTVAEVMRKQSAGEIHAAGFYQIIGKTLKGLMEGAYGQTGVKSTDLFDAATQDKLGAALARNRVQPGMSMQEIRAGLRAEWIGLQNVSDARLDEAIRSFEASGRTSFGGSSSMTSSTAMGAGVAAVDSISISKAIEATRDLTGVNNQCAIAVKRFMEVLGMNTSVMDATARSAERMGTVMTDWSQLKPGDIVARGQVGDPTHVGVYTGGQGVFHQSGGRGLKTGNYNDLGYFKEQGYFIRPNAGPMGAPSAALMNMPPVPAFNPTPVGPIPEAAGASERIRQLSAQLEDALKLDLGALIDLNDVQSERALENLKQKIANTVSSDTSELDRQTGVLADQAGFLARNLGTKEEDLKLAVARFEAESKIALLQEQSASAIEKSLAEYDRSLEKKKEQGATEEEINRLLERRAQLESGLREGAAQAIANQEKQNAAAERNLQIQNALGKLSQANSTIAGINQSLQDQADRARVYYEYIEQGINPALAEQLTQIDLAVEKGEEGLAQAKEKLSLAISQNEAAINQLSIDIASLDAGAEKIKKEAELKAIMEDQVKLKKQLAGLPEEGEIAQGASATRQGAIDQDSFSNKIKAASIAAREELNTLLDPANQVIGTANAIGDAFSSAFSDAVSGAKSLKEAASDMFKSIGDYFIQMAAQMLAQKAILSLLGLFAGGGGGGGSPIPSSFPVGNFGGNISGIGAIGGFFSIGGYAKGGTPNVVGEEGPELFIPGVSGTVVPNDVFDATKEALARDPEELADVEEEAERVGALQAAEAAVEAARKGRDGADGTDAALTVTQQAIAAANERARGQYGLSDDAAGLGASTTEISNSSVNTALKVNEGSLERTREAMLLNERSLSQQKEILRERNNEAVMERMLAEPGELSLKYEATTINGMRFVTEEQLQRATAESARRGRDQALKALQTSVRARKQVGI